MAGKGFVGPLRLPIYLVFAVDLLSFLLLLLLLSSTKTAADAPSEEADILLDFKSTLNGGGGGGGGEIEALRSWAAGSNPCNSDNSHSTWTCVYCTRGKVWALQLERMRLSGQLNVTALGNLPGLRAISFMDNEFVGPMPDIAKLGALKALYLSNNRFSGDIPDAAFSGTRSLKKVYLSNNDFTGKIPSSLAQLSKLMFLRLDDNQFEGQIPDLAQPGLKLLNVSFNKLEGSIPQTLNSMMDQSLFAGNDKLCGPPLEVSCPSPLTENKNKSHGLLIGIIVGCMAAVLILALIIVALFKSSSKDNTLAHPAAGKRDLNAEILDADKLEQGSSAAAAAAAAAGSGGGVGGGKKGAHKEADGHGRLCFIKEDRKRFELQDLLKASAEVLGSGNFGSSYKAVLIEGPSVVVKRFKEMNRVGREDFQEHMRRLGRLSHPNVLPLVAYYYRKEEKLIITDYILNGSLAHMLHGSRGSSIPPLEWPTCLKIIKGVARGLAYLHEELPMLTLPHGHLKSSNVLIDDNYEPFLMDYALVPLVNQTHASQILVAYKSPEVTETGKPSKKSDVWSLGILILEVLTGQFPATYLQKGKGKGGTDLAGWVNSVVKEEVFDGEMKRAKNGEGQMSKLLQIGLGCCERSLDKRWDIKDALDKIEELKEIEEDGTSSSSSSSFMSEVQLNTTSS